MMKRILSCIAIVGLITLASCGGDSPTAKPAPTVVPAQWTISLVADPATAYVGDPITLTANATKDGASAPDGTIVTFTIPVYDPLSGVVVMGTKQVLTEAGVAYAYFALQRIEEVSLAATYSIKARVHAVEVSTLVTISERGDGDILKITNVLPPEGAFDGGEQVIFQGTAIAAPVEVVFDVGGNRFSAEIVSVQDSVPLGAAGQITVRTPYITGVDRSEAQVTLLEFTTGIGTSNEQEFEMKAGFTYLAEQELQVFQALDPNSGSYDGGDTVVLTGRGIRAPARVTFILVGSDVEFPAIVHSVNESVPASSEGTIIIETPFIPEGERPIDPVLGLQINYVNVRVEVAIDQPNILEQELPSAFTYTPQGSTLPEVWRLGEPSMYILIDDFGANQGGETVTILGRNFRARKYASDGVTVVDTAAAVTSVIFASGLEAQVLTVSEDGTQVQVLTPRYQVTPLDVDTPVPVTLTTEYPLAVDPGPYTITRPAGYVYQADRPTPVITALLPIAGPLDGGTLVTINGHGFQFPLQVTFGNLAAEEVNLFDDQTLDDNDLITCISPNYSQQNEVPPVAVEVQVRNVESGKVSNTETFTYGDNLYITGNTPAEGGRGGLVIIYGSGFEDPLQVEFGSEGAGVRLEVISVSGTELTVKFPEDLDPVCANQSGSFIVTLLERDGDTELGTAEGGNYTYLGNTPIVISVDPRFVQSYDANLDGVDGDGVMPAEVTISGVRFGPEVFVDIDSFRMDSSDVTLVDNQTIDIINLPPWNDFNLPSDWHRTECLTDLGELGERLLPTPIDVRVTNTPENCQDTLIGAIIYEPESNDCVPPAFAMQVTPVNWNFTADLEVATFTVTNTGLNAIDLLAAITVETTVGVFTISTSPASPLASGASTTVEVTIAAVAAQVDTGILTIDGSDGLGGSATFDFDLTETVP